MAGKGTQRHSRAREFSVRLRHNHNMGQVFMWYGVNTVVHHLMFGPFPCDERIRSVIWVVCWLRAKICRQFGWWKQMICAEWTSCWRKCRPPNDSDHYKFPFTLLIFSNTTARLQYAMNIVIWWRCKRRCWLDNSIWTHVGCVCLSHPLPSFIVVIRK